MKKIVIAAVALALTAGAAEARKMSTMEWVDPQSMDIWRSLSEQEKVESVQSYLKDNQTSEDRQAVLETKVRACIEKEIADPDYKDIHVPLMMPMTFCLSKYAAILDAQKK